MSQDLMQSIQLSVEGLSKDAIDRQRQLVKASEAAKAKYTSGLEELSIQEKAAAETIATIQKSLADNRKKLREQVEQIYHDEQVRLGLKNPEPFKGFVTLTDNSLKGVGQVAGHVGGFFGKIGAKVKAGYASVK